MMRKVMMKNSVEASRSRSSEGIDCRGYRHITPTQAAWAYVNDIKYNYYNLFLTKNGKIIIVRIFYCNYIVCSICTLYIQYFSTQQKYIKSTSHNSPRANQSLCLTAKALDNQSLKFNNYELSRNKCTGSISIP